MTATAEELTVARQRGLMEAIFAICLLCRTGHRPRQSIKNEQWGHPSNWSEEDWGRSWSWCAAGPIWYSISQEYAESMIWEPDDFSRLILRRKELQ